MKLERVYYGYSNRWIHAGRRAEDGVKFEGK